MLKLYNSATRQKEELIPNEAGKIKMYTCGPTVYHFAHIGNLRTYIMEDILDRYLRFTGLDVLRVMNITDVGHLSSDGDTGEDKMLKGAKREKKTVIEIAKFYTDAFFADCKKLNIRTPDVVEPATGCIPEFIALVEGLLAKGYAYEAARAFFDYLIGEKGARRIYAYTEDYNVSSQKLCEKLGMRREGLFVEFVSFVKDEDGNPIYENTYQYAILKREWEQNGK